MEGREGSEEKSHKEEREGESGTGRGQGALARMEGSTWIFVQGPASF